MPQAMTPKTKTVKSLLDDVFTRPEKEVTYFVGVMAANSPAAKMPGKNAKFKDQLQSGKPDQIKAAVFTMQVSGQIQIRHGWDGDDYVWHIEPISRRKWKTSVERATYATIKTMSTTIPSDVFVKIFPPFSDWEIKVITFKAMKLRNCWNVSQTDLDRLNAKLFPVLNALV